MSDRQDKCKKLFWTGINSGIIILILSFFLNNIVAPNIPCWLKGTCYDGRVIPSPTNPPEPLPKPPAQNPVKKPLYKQLNCGSTISIDWGDYLKYFDIVDNKIECVDEITNTTIKFIVEAKGNFRTSPLDSDSVTLYDLNNVQFTNTSVQYDPDVYEWKKTERSYAFIKISSDDFTKTSKIIIQKQ